MRPTHHLVLNVRFRVTKSTVKVKSCGKVISVSIYFDCKLASSGYAYPLNIAKFPPHGVKRHALLAESVPTEQDQSRCESIKI